MADSRIEKLAELVVNYSVAVRPDDKVAIMSNSLSMVLANSIYAKTLQAGGNPMIFFHNPDKILYRYGTKEQIEYVHDPIRTVIEKYDVRINIWAEENTKELSRVDPVKMEWFSRARKDLVKTMLQRAAEGKLRWVIAPYPTPAFAQDAEMSLSEYEDFLYNACMPDINDPIRYWENVSREHQKIIDWLADKKEVHITGKETDLRLNVAGRKFINCDGHYNLPDGEIFTGPVEDSAEGHVYFSYPAIERGHEVTGIRLWFHNGKVIKATAEKNEDFLNKTLDTDAGARYLGEFAIGTNYGITGFTKEILFDEKIGGSFHLAVGAGYPESGSHAESAIHWDMVCDLRDGGEITADNQTLYKNGRFVI